MVNSLSLLFHSIRFRLALWFVLILALLLAVFSGLLFYMQIQELRAETCGFTSHVRRIGAPVAADSSAARHASTACMASRGETSAGFRPSVIQRTK